MTPLERALVLSSIVAMIATLAPRVAHAGEADRLFQLGRRASSMGKYGTACSLFRESFQLDPAVGTLLNLGDCEEQQNHVAASLDYYQAALSRLPPSDDRLAPVRARIEAIQERSGHLELRLGEGAPHDAKVIVDGEPIPSEKLATALLLPAGGHLVVVTAVGYRGSRQTVTIAAGETKAVSLWPGPELEETELALASDDREGRAAREHRARTLRVAGWTATGVGVASLWVGSVAGLFAIDRESLRSENCDAQNACNATGASAAHSGKTFATVSTITLLAGAIAAGGGVYLVLSNGAADAEASQAAIPRRTTIGAHPLARGAGITLDREF
jgi:hypothetical protein